MIDILFNSFVFLYFIITLFLLLLVFKNKNYRQAILLVASLFFYWYSSHALILLLIFSTILDFNCGQAIYNTSDPKKKKFYLFISLLGNLGLLGFFKYTNFFIDSFNGVSTFLGLNINISTLSIILPIGISFYTFQTLSYTLDIYWGKLKPTNSIFKFALFVTFFPQLVAGPIVRASDFLPQLDRKVLILSKNFKPGLTLVMWGLIKKVIFADNIAPFVDLFFNNPNYSYGSFPIILATIGFGIQIYCDFSGYSDIAIGISRILGYELRLNFDKPYFSKSITEFWRKWHMSLSSWLRDYLYIPLGGNRKGKTRTYINLMITMALGGLWHGAAWHFMFWGIFQGLGLTVHKFTSEHNMNTWFNWFGSFKKYVLILFTQYFVFLGWLIFRISDTSFLLYSIKQYLFIGFNLGITQLENLFFDNLFAIIMIVVFIMLHTYSYFNKDIITKISESDNFYWSLFLFSSILLLLFLYPVGSRQFIYFQF